MFSIVGSTAWSWMLRLPRLVPLRALSQMVVADDEP